MTASRCHLIVTPMTSAAPTQARTGSGRVRPAGAWAGACLAGSVVIALVAAMDVYVAVERLRWAAARERDNAVMPTVYESTVFDSGWRPVWITVLLLTIAGFTGWLYRSARFAEVLGGELRHAPRWAIGGWVLPPLGAVVVPQLLSDVYRETVGEATGWRTRAWPVWLLLTLIVLHATVTGQDSLLHGRAISLGPREVLLSHVNALAVQVTLMTIVVRVTRAQRTVARRR